MTPLLHAGRAIATAFFALLVAAGAILYRRLEAKARAEEAEALLDAEFARLERGESGDTAMARLDSALVRQARTTRGSVDAISSRNERPT